jgi:mono/diheme cytochrome c family protein
MVLQLLEWSRLATGPMGTIVPRFGSALHFFGGAVLLGGMIASHPAVLDAARSGSRKRRWGWIGLSAFVVGGAIQSCVVVVLAPRLLITGYGLLVLVKVALLAAPIPFWVWWRRQTLSAKSISIGRRVQWFVFTAIALALSLFLDVWTPALRMNPLWPISWTTSLDVAASDPVIRIQWLHSSYWLAPASLLLIVSMLLRYRLQRLWWIGLVLSTYVIWWKWPDLSPLVVPAYPTTYFQSPTGFAAASITSGEALYRDHCAGCHGSDGRGDGPAAGVLPRPPADLTARHLWMHPDGELFWWISHGIDGQGGTKLMPGFGHSLGEDGVWNVIDYVRARNGGFVRATQGHWSPTLLAPDFPISCAAGNNVSLSAFRSKPVRLVIGKALTANPGMTTITVMSTITVADSPSIDASRSDLCVADRSVATAYAIVVGLSASDVDGSQFLIDRHGWLRELQKPATSAAWDDPERLARALWLLDAVPISASTAICHAQD